MRGRVALYGQDVDLVLDGVIAGDAETLVDFKLLTLRAALGHLVKYLVAFAAEIDLVIAIAVQVLGVVEDAVFLQVQKAEEAPLGVAFVLDQAGVLLLEALAAYDNGVGRSLAGLELYLLKACLIGHIDVSVALKAARCGLRSFLGSRLSRHVLAVCALIFLVELCHAVHADLFLVAAGELAADQNVIGIFMTIGANF